HYGRAVRINDLPVLPEALVAFERARRLVSELALFPADLDPVDTAICIHQREIVLLAGADGAGGRRERAGAGDHHRMVDLLLGKRGWGSHESEKRERRDLSLA